MRPIGVGAMTLAREIWTSRSKSFYSDEQGASAIEFAIVSMIFFALVFGIVIYSAYFASYVVVGHIAGEAARASVAGLNDTERAQIAVSRANSLISEFALLLDEESMTVEAGPSATAGVFEVTISHQASLFGLSNLSGFLPMPPTEQRSVVLVSNGGY
jgi:Flp pilus assembly protein TadG